MEKEKIRVLIAEDDFLIAEEISKAIKNLGYLLVGTAPNANKAIELTESLHPDVVIMDIQLSKMDGFNATQLIFNRYPSPVVIITTHEPHDFVEKSSERGIAAYLTKPPKAEEIDRAITIAMDRHQDVLKYKKLIADLEENKNQLDFLHASKNRLFSILAHDLRSPVSSLSVFSDQLIINFDTLEKHELLEYLSVIQNTSKSISDLLENLLIWAGFQVNTVDLKKEPLQRSEIVNSVETLLMAALQHKNISLINKIPAHFKVLGDANMINVILRNLVSNAIKFTSPGGKIEIHAEEQDEFLVISVKDNGVGIPVANLHKIFNDDIQFTNIGTMGEKGTGLGLILCKEMVEKHGGKIWVNSMPGNGTTFFFTLQKVQH